MKTTNQILEVVREKCGLKKLKVGCFVEIKDSELKSLVGSIVRVDSDWRARSCLRSIDVEELYKQIKNGNAEIIGLEPQLNHLLLTVFEKGKSLNISQLGELFKIENGERKYLGDTYNLQLTVAENLDQNPELRKLVGELILN